MDAPVYIASKIPGTNGYWTEHDAISMWVQANETCPLSRRHLTMNEVRAQRDLIFLLDRSHSMTRSAVSDHMRKTLSAEKVHAAQDMRSLDLSAYMILFILQAMPEFYCTFTVIVFCKTSRVLCKRQLLTRESLTFCEQQLRLLSPGTTTNWQDPLLLALKEAKISQQCDKIETTLLMFTDGEPTEKQQTTLDTIRNAALGMKNVQLSVFIYGDEANAGLYLLNELSRCVNQKGNGGLFFVPSPLEMFDITTSVPIQWVFNFLQKSTPLSTSSSTSTSSHVEYINLLSQVISICTPKQLYSTFEVPSAAVAKARSVLNDAMHQHSSDAVPIDPCVDQALSYINTWGLPALYTLRCQHELQYTANVFDDSTQHYQQKNDQLRNTIRETLQSFTATGRICAPLLDSSDYANYANHTNANTNANYANCANANVAAPISLSQIYVADGCVTGDTVFYNEAGPILVTDLVKNNGGSIFISPHKTATIQHIICREIPRESDILILNKESSLAITSWHPVMPIHPDTKPVWMFAKECIHVKMKDSEKHGASDDTQIVYAFVFAPDEKNTRAATIWTPSHYVAAAGHGLVCPKQNPVIGHPYWGKKVLDDIQKISTNVCVLMN